MTSLLKRLNNVWKLSAFEPRVRIDSPEGTVVVQNLIKTTTEKARFIPFTKQDPVKAITDETP